MTSGLSGDDYTICTRTDATRDDEATGRWVAADESGWDGEQLYGRADRYLSIGSVALDDEYAHSIVEQLRQDTGIRQPPELKFSQFAGKAGRIDALADLLSSGGALAGRVRIYLVDKHYFITSKTIDLLIEERASKRGVNLYADDLARRLAWTLFDEGPRALGVPGFEHLISTVVNFASRRNADGSQISVDELFEEFDRAWVRSYRRRVTDILMELRKTRAEAEDHLDSYSSDRFPEMEPLIPSVAHLAGIWAEEIGGMSMLVDEQRALTDTVLDAARRMASLDRTLIGTTWRVRRKPWDKAVRSIVRGSSRDHPSIQLADLIAGAGRAVARRHAGSSSVAGDRLYPLIVPLITKESMVPHDEPARFAEVSEQ
ncbi:hypothetical protein Airi02_012930 [Actinoallomurus iriomotensis]|uniref:DUF3800 domain-containing protein n=1 Tax=Actinoallomurus iriomotensis TaxID=478107 RepID=A0A9W6VSH4_9ACTN|nr:hypothetical protein Airi02_012930 [Actinoallomurus iriomotensis]